MTLGEAIDRVDYLRYNAFTREEKAAWLAQLERMLKRNILDTHEEGLPFQEPGEDTPLTAPESFDMMYLRWLEAQIDYANQEYMKYNNAMALFTALWQEYANQVRRSSPAVGRRTFF